MRREALGPHFGSHFLYTLPRLSRRTLEVEGFGLTLTALRSAGLHLFLAPAGSHEGALGPRLGPECGPNPVAGTGLFCAALRLRSSLGRRQVFGGAAPELMVSTTVLAWVIPSSPRRGPASGPRRQAPGAGEAGCALHGPAGSQVGGSRPACTACSVVDSQGRVESTEDQRLTRSDEGVPQFSPDIRVVPVGTVTGDLLGLGAHAGCGDRLDRCHRHLRLGGGAAVVGGEGLPLASQHRWEPGTRCPAR